MNDLITVENIKDKIYEIRGKQVMLDSDLAKLYNLETKVFMQTIKRHIQKLPKASFLQLSKSEYNYFLRSQIVTSKPKNGDNRGGRTYLPYAFTKEAIMILSSIIKKNNSIDITNQIIDTLSGNEIITTNSLNPYKIKDYIYDINDIQVMTDYDLARFFECKNGTKEINQAVNRNLEKFPDRFSWILTDEESKNFLVTNCDQKNETRGGKYKKPRVFTEQGIYMLATILRSKKAISASIFIMDAFVLMRKKLIDYKDMLISINNINNKFDKYNNRLENHDKKINYILSKIDKKEFLYLPGQTFDAYTDIISILKEASNEIIIIDPYLDINILNIIKIIEISVILITSNKSKLTKQDISKYNEQYNNLKNIFYDNTFHDRYFILDKNGIYHCGTSINNAGNKLFNINKLDDDIIKDNLLKYINRII